MGRDWFVGVVVALALHGALAAVLGFVDSPALRSRSNFTVEMEIKDRPLPPENKPKPALEVEPPVAPRPRIAKRTNVPPPEQTSPPREPPPPPPPNQEPPPTAAKSAVPIFGVTSDSVVAGDAEMAVPVGNTLMTASRVRGKPGEIAEPYEAPAGPPATSYNPVPDSYIKDFPVKLNDVNSFDIYPPEAKMMGIEGSVGLRVNIDDRGNVVGVKVSVPAGHGFDEAAAKAMWRIKFTPARTRDGRPVPYRMSYSYRFTIGR